MAASSKLHRELRKIAEYRSLCITKYMLVLFLVLIYFPMRPMPGYMIIFSLALPYLLRLNVFAAKEGKKDAVNSFVMLPTAKEYGFTMQKYRSEKLSGNSILFLLLLWQYSVIRYKYFEMPFVYIPILYAIIYLATRTLLKYALFFYLHHRIMTLQNCDDDSD